HNWAKAHAEYLPLATSHRKAPTKGFFHASVSPDNGPQLLIKTSVRRTGHDSFCGNPSLWRQGLPGYKILRHKLALHIGEMKLFKLRKKKAQLRQGIARPFKGFPQVFDQRWNKS